jgi:transposase-like protein
MRKRKLTVDHILKIIGEHFEEGKSSRTIAAKYGISHATVEEWLVQYKANGITAFIRDGRNKTYSTELKLQAVGDYLNGAGSYKALSAKYGLRSTMQLREWVKVYNSGRGFRQKMSGGSRMKEARPTTAEERIQIAKDCIANGGNYGETALKFNVSYQQVYQWVKKFKEKGDAGLEDRRGKRLKDQTPRTREEELEIEIAKLRHELYMTRMERDVLKKLDEIVRRDAYRK